MSRQINQVCLLLGSNIEPQRNLARAVALLGAVFPLRGVSKIWQTPAAGSPGPDFLNQAVLLTTALDLETLKLFVLRPLEARLGRVRSGDKNAPRTIDIDIVVWNHQVVDANVWKWAHAAVPVAELLPGFERAETGEKLESIASQLKQRTPMRVFAPAHPQSAYSRG